MSRQSFIEDHPYVSDLMRYAWENDVYRVDESIISRDSLDERVEEEIREYLHSDGWWNLGSYLNDIDTGYDYYWTGDGWFDYTGADENVYNDILYMIVDELGEDAVFGDDEEDEDEDEEEEEECSISETELNGLFPLSSGALRSING